MVTNTLRLSYDWKTCNLSKAKKHQGKYPAYREDWKERTSKNPIIWDGDKRLIGGEVIPH